VRRGLAGLLFAVRGRGVDDQFLLRQRHPIEMRASDVEAPLKTAPEPVAPHRRDAVSVSCTPRRSRRLRNPWRCAVSYRSGRTARLRVVVRSDGSYVGYFLARSGSVVGCCVAPPGTR
jgi:hypothetical protein